MRIPDDYKTWNVSEQINDSSSVLSFWKQVLALRKQYEDDLVNLPILEKVMTNQIDIRVVPDPLAGR
jgi:glycosidase